HLPQVQPEGVVGGGGGLAQVRNLVGFGLVPVVRLVLTRALSGTAPSAFASAPPRRPGFFVLVAPPGSVVLFVSAHGGYSAVGPLPRAAPRAGARGRRPPTPPAPAAVTCFALEVPNWEGIHKTLARQELWSDPPGRPLPTRLRRRRNCVGRGRRP